MSDETQLTPEQRSLMGLRAPEAATAPGMGAQPMHLKPEFHQHRHVYLHRALDELVADWIRHTVHLGGDKTLTTATIMDLMQWSYEQTQQPSVVEAT